MVVRLFLLPTQTTQNIFNYHPLPFQIDPSSDFILENLASSNQNRRHDFTPPQLTKNRRTFHLAIPPNWLSLLIGELIVEPHCG